MRWSWQLLIVAAAMPIATPLTAQDSDAHAKADQNPVAAMISLPFQNNTFVGVGPHGEIANVLDIQSVVPIGAGDWNIISRTIAPMIYVQDLAPGPSVEILHYGPPSRSAYSSSSQSERDCAGTRYPPQIRAFAAVPGVALSVFGRSSWAPIFFEDHT